MTTSYQGASSAYFHPRRPRKFRAGDRVRCDTFAFDHEFIGGNYPGAARFGTILEVTYLSDRPNAVVRFDDRYTDNQVPLSQLELL